MSRIFTAVLFGLFASALSAGVVNVTPEQGRPIASIHWTDETGHSRQLSEFSGYPLILLPIYTRCPGPCLQNVDHLKDALADSANNPRQFRVLLFSFDPTDDAAVLTKYRRRENIPLAWSIGVAAQNDIDALLDSIGVQVGKAGQEFTHPNIVLFLDSNLRVSKWIYGTAYSGRDVDLSLRVAAGESDWIGQHSQLIYALLIFAGSLLCVALSYYAMQLAALRRSGRRDTPIEPFATDQ